ncbi:peptidase M61 [uncultured Eudoraea sp.]|uniref:M61 family metallopeptidase n=1 Tax=uncultured Eudoraea sp. TaxID=1035614 RepID=UPI00262D5620|nr:peptidase M61 [uncultured Eudoraea sp.]
MKKFIILYVFLVLLYGCGTSKSVLSADKAVIEATIDLVNVNNDRVSVTINPGSFSNQKISFFIPKMVPGTYREDDYGKYIQDLKAIDYQGNELLVTAVGTNEWNISDATKLDKITYYVTDTYDTESEVNDQVFSPAGTNILEGKNFVLNLHGFIGYFDGLKEVPYELVITSPSDLVPTTSLMKKQDEINSMTDTYLASRYFEVVDNPILYSKSNTASFVINDITVNLSVYSPNSIYSGADLQESMERMMKAQKAFLGEIDGTKEYNILLYLSTLDETDASGFGALEHHTSTLVVLPEQMPIEALEKAMIDVVSHEFFHIVTPLNVHSKEIQYFDYNDPKMSEHLWMYEGTTEYFANLFQIQQGLIDEAEFYKRIVDKINNANSYDDEMSFTTMSRNILEDPYKANYANVYEKGALINMSLDIRLRDLSNGEKGVLWLMKELSKKYDNDTPFEDDELIGEIVDLTYPEIKSFFDTYVAGNTPLNYDEILASVGLKTAEIQERSGYFLNGEIPFIDIDQNNNDAIIIRSGIELNTFFTGLGAQGGDTIKSIDGMPISLESIRPIIGQSFGWTSDREITMVVQRGEEELILQGKVGTPMLKITTIVPIDNLENTPQSKLRRSWLKG